MKDLKLHNGSQLRIYDCIRVDASIVAGEEAPDILESGLPKCVCDGEVKAESSLPTYLCTSLAEAHPSGLPFLPGVVYAA